MLVILSPSLHHHLSHCQLLSSSANPPPLLIVKFCQQFCRVTSSHHTCHTAIGISYSSNAHDRSRMTRRCKSCLILRLNKPINIFEFLLNFFFKSRNPIAITAKRDSALLSSPLCQVTSSRVTWHQLVSCSYSSNACTPV